MRTLFRALVLFAAFAAAPALAGTIAGYPVASPQPSDILLGDHLNGTWATSAFTVKSLAPPIAQLITPSMLAAPSSQAQGTFPTPVNNYPYIFPVPVSVPTFVVPSPVPTPVGTAPATPLIAVGYQQGGNVIAFAPAYDYNPIGGRDAAFGYGAMGNESLYALEEAAFGWNALEYSNEGQWNEAIGPEALRYLNSQGTYYGGVNAAQNNLAVGQQALLSLCSGQASAPNGITLCTTANQGDNNVAVGEEVMYLATTAANNTCVGFNACWNISTGGANEALGADAMQNTTTGQFNFAVGVTSLANNTTGSSNIAIGFDSDYSATAPSYDVLVGQQTAYTGSGGSNTAVGYQSLFAQTTGFSNVAVGFGAGNSVTSGFRLTLIGAGAQPAAATDNTETVVGYGATGNGSNTVTLGASGSTAQVYTSGGYCPGNVTVKGTACVYSGTGVPSFSAPNGSIYMRYDGTPGTNIFYVNTSGASTSGTTWTAKF